MMVTVEEAVIARLDREGERFEILVDPGAAQKLRSKEKINIVNHLAVDRVFKDSKKGLEASRENLEKVFGTTEVGKIATQIVLRGGLQITTEQRKHMIEEKRRKIIARIARDATNPQTGFPHPPARIEQAMKEAMVKIDPQAPVSKQMEGVVKELRTLLPLSFERIQIAIKLPGKDYGKAYGDLKGLGSIKQEEWQSDGSWVGVVEIPAGAQDKLRARIKSKTCGKAEFKII